MSSEQLEQESLIRQRMAEEETIRERRDEDGKEQLLEKWHSLHSGETPVHEP
jgi:hypothetical protein